MRPVLGIDARERVSSEELRQAIREADVVVGHAGMGSAVTAFDLGKTPLLLPREASFGEHVDDHQQLTASELQRRGLAVSVLVNDLTLDDLQEARTGRVTKDGVIRPFELNLSAPAQGSGKRRNSVSRTQRHARVNASTDRDELMLAHALAEVSEGSPVVARAELRSVVGSPTASDSTRATALDTLVELLQH